MGGEHAERQIAYITNGTIILKDGFFRVRAYRKAEARAALSQEIVMDKYAFDRPKQALTIRIRDFAKRQRQVCSRL